MPKRTCSVESCDRSVASWGMCDLHYRRELRRPDWTPPAPPTVLERLAARSIRVGDCLVWTGAKGGPMRYGQIGINDKVEYVHRAAWIARHGPIPPETPYVLHRCDNPPCWADEHLFLGTHQDNMDDAVAKGRTTKGRVLVTHCPHGHLYDEANTYVKPTGWRACRACARARAFARYHATH